MKQSTETYTRRENARRAGVAVGIPKARVQITVHKIGDKVRFGWKEGQSRTKTPETTEFAPANKSKALMNERNGIKRPKSSGLCAAVWDWLDENPQASISEAKVEGDGRGWNTNNVTCEYYQWRKFWANPATLTE